MSRSTINPTLPPPTPLHLQPLPRGDSFDVVINPREWKPLPTWLCDRNRRFYPSPPNATPSSLFTPLLNNSTRRLWRFIRKGDARRTQALFFIDGACSNNGGNTDSISASRRGSPRGGAAAIIGPNAAGYVPVKEALPLDNVRHTSNRAELQAAIIAVSARGWRGEGFTNVILATDSEYLVLGIGERIHKWIERGWRTANGGEVANRDMWEHLLRKIRERENEGCHVQFWLIPRTLNEADAYAKEAAEIPDSQRPPRFLESLGMV